MSLKFYNAYSSVAADAAKETISVIAALPVPISIMHAITSPPATVFMLLSKRFDVVVSEQGVLASLNGFAPVRGFTYFIQGVEVSGSASVLTLLVPPGGFLEVVARK